MEDVVHSDDVLNGTVKCQIYGLIYYECYSGAITTALSRVVVLQYLLFFGYS